MKTSIRDLPFSEADIQITKVNKGNIVFELRNSLETFCVQKPIISKANLNKWKKEYFRVGTKMHVVIKIVAPGTGGEYGLLIVENLYDDNGIPISSVKDSIPVLVPKTVKEKPVLAKSTLVDNSEIKVEDVEIIEVPAEKEPTIMVSVTEEVLVKQSVDIDIYSLTDDHLEDMNRLALMNVIRFLIAAHNGTAQELMDSSRANLVDDDYVDTEPVTRDGSVGNKNTFDHKIGKSSKYKYVYFDNSKGDVHARWRWQVEKKTGSNISEEIAALLVDEYLDSIQDDKRSRNRDEFPEIMAIYEVAKKNVQKVS